MGDSLSASLLAMCHWTDCDPGAPAMDSRSELANLFPWWSVQVARHDYCRSTPVLRGPGDVALLVESTMACVNDGREDAVLFSELLDVVCCGEQECRITEPSHTQRPRS